MPKELNAEDKLGIDDSFSSFTILRDDKTDIDNVKDGGTDDDATNDDENVTDDENVSEEDSNFEFDLSKAPDDVKNVLEPILKKMQSAYNKKTQGIAELKRKAAVAEVLLSRGGKPGIADTNTENDANKGGKEAEFNSILGELKNLQFEAGDYYAPFFKKVINAVEAVANTAKKEVTSVRQENTVNSIKKWFKDNPEALPLMAKMDEIGRANPTLYNDLDDLYVLASVKSGKGLPKSGSSKSLKVENKPKIKPRPTSLRNVIEITGLPNRGKAAPKVETMEDAFKLAQEQLAE